MEDRNYESFLDKYAQTGRIPLADVQKWFNDSKRIPTRTFQWYTHENLIPPPEFEGRNGFYTRVRAELLYDAITFLFYLKSCTKSQFSIWKKILIKHSTKIRALLDIALNLARQYPIYKDDDWGQNLPNYVYENEQICLKVLEALSAGELVPRRYKQSDLKFDLLNNPMEKGVLADVN